MEEPEVVEVVKKSPRCIVCKLEKRKKAFNLDLENSVYYKKGGKTLDTILAEYKCKFTKATLYRHLQLHCPAPEGRKSELEVLLATYDPNTIHEDTLKEILIRGNMMVKSGKLKLTTQNILQAIKTKSEIDRANKDRKVEMMKALMLGAAPSGAKQIQPDNPTSHN